MSTSKKQNETITGETKGQITKKSGKGNNHGFVSEVSAYMTVKQGHEEEARAACSPLRRDAEATPTRRTYRRPVCGTRGWWSSMTVGDSCSPLASRPSGTRTSTMPF